METDNPFLNSSLTNILVVADLQVARSFYVDVLGAKVFREYGGDSIVLQFLENWLLLVLPGPPTDDKPSVYFSTVKNKKEVSHSFTIRVGNCQSTYNLLIEKGCRFLTPPVKHGAETRCFFFDPDGHLFEISEYAN